MFEWSCFIVFPCLFSLPPMRAWDFPHFARNMFPFTIRTLSRICIFPKQSLIPSLWKTELFYIKKLIEYNLKKSSRWYLFIFQNKGQMIECKIFFWVVAMFRVLMQHLMPTFLCRIPVTLIGNLRSNVPEDDAYIWHRNLKTF